MFYETWGERSSKMRRGFSLIEMLVAMVLFGAIGMVCSLLIWPVLLKAYQVLAGDNDDLRIQAALRLIRADVVSTTSKGRNFAHLNNAWVLGIVPLDVPGSTGNVRWQTQLLAYRFEGGELRRATLSDLKWPDGTARLSETLPALFSGDELWALPQTQSKLLLQKLQAEPWTDLRAPWTFKFRNPRGQEQTYSLNLAAFL